MKSNTLLPLALALSVSLFATACKRDADVTPSAEPAEPAAVETAAAPDKQGPPPSPPMPAPAPAARAMDSGMTFAVMDKNGDGGITRDELADTEMLHQHFSAADNDGDGKLSSGRGRHPSRRDAYTAGEVTGP